ncbi:SDR family NAD(P)-dependent oxidoreductase [Pseudomonas sp. PDM09]|uniref:SDR family NAD(P)-dependent oxidoreductase n=1 Tax=Pseudomonas sp. PDM09 TaxID=2769270 RepID=UPI0017852708|nr:SDR family NAD(P)-dependent oxidoreductase [Pseudomonas sp. PDM09]MBD9562245.1 SDR family NAD(P)-dependent oxidoreductase [Pseudomonas sp. PDM09]
MDVVAGQVAVITGAASGIGLALAMAFAQRGVHIALLDIESEALSEAARNVMSKGVQVLPLVCDVANRAEVEAARDQVLERFGRVDILCNNAGVMLPFGPLWTLDATGWEWILNVNLRGVFNGLHVFTPLLVAQDSGYVVTTASMAGVSTIPGNAAYNATKHAVVSLTETLEADLRVAGSKVGVTVLCCGLVRTRIRDAARNRPGHSNVPLQVPDAAASASGAGHIDPEEVAKQVLDAIAQGQLYLFTNPNSQVRVRTRFERMLADC